MYGFSRTNFQKFQIFKWWSQEDFKDMKNFEVEEVGAEEVGFQRKYSGRVVEIVYKIYNFKIFKIAK